MRSLRELVFDEYVMNSTPIYTAPRWNAVLGSLGSLSLHAVCDSASGSITGTVAIQHSCDNLNFVPKNVNPEIDAQAIAAATTNNLSGFDDGTLPMAGFARLQITLGGSTPSAHVRVYATGRSGAAFRATQLPGCVLWLRADQGIAFNSGNVKAWADQSGSNNAASQATSGNQFGYEVNDANVAGMATLKATDGARIMSTPSISLAAGYTVFSVAYALNPLILNYVGLFRTASASSTDTGSGHVAVYNVASSNVEWSSSDGSTWTSQSPGNTYALASRTILCIQSDGTSGGRAMRLNGQSQSLTNAGTYGNPTGALPVWVGGAQNVGSGNWFTGELAEQIVFSRKLSVPECQLVEAYLGARYGIAVSH